MNKKNIRYYKIIEKPGKGGPVLLSHSVDSEKNNDQ